MQSLNNDMDDLFRRAAEHYPLKPVGADWEKVAARLKAEEEAGPKATSHKDSWWLLLVLPFCFLFHTPDTKGDPGGTSGGGAATALRSRQPDHRSGPSSTTTAGRRTGTPAADEAAKAEPGEATPPAGAAVPVGGTSGKQPTLPAAAGAVAGKQAYRETESAAAGQKVISGGTMAGQTAANKRSAAKQPAARPAQGSVAQVPREVTGGKEGTARKQQESIGRKHREGAVPSAGRRISRNGRLLRTKREESAADREASVLAGLSGDRKTKIKQAVPVAETLPQSIGEAAMQTTLADVPPKQRGAATTGTMPEDSSRLKKDPAQDSLPPAPEAGQVIPAVARKRTGKFYAGILAGPDVSRVKTDRIHGAGYSAGLTGGYRFGKRLGVEASLLWGKKEYYSEGENFNTAKMNLPSRYRIVNATGSCTMIELPVTVRFTFAAIRQHSWVAAAGISSYLMKKEEYYCLYKYYSTTYYASRDYKNASRNWASVLHLSAGYQHKVGAAYDLRVEPYLKVPLKGLGVGSLPMSSVGLYLGITRTIR